MGSQVTVSGKTQRKKIGAGPSDACLYTVLVRGAIATMKYHVQNQGGEERICVVYASTS